MPKNCLFAVFLAILISTPASAQFVITGDVGQMKTQFGDPRNPTAFQEPVRSTPYGAFSLGGVAFGHSQRTHGVNFYGGFDLKFPTSQSGSTGNPFEFGFLGQVNYRHGPVSIGAGLEGREFSFPDGLPARPAQFLIGVPVSGKVTFGPAGRAYVQGGVTPYVYAYAQTFVNGGATGPSGSISNGTFALDNTASSYETRVSGGYMFGNFGLRAGYIHRIVLFNVTGGEANNAFYDFKQDMISGGIVLSLF